MGRHQLCGAAWASEGDAALAHVEDHIVLFHCGCPDDDIEGQVIDHKRRGGDRPVLPKHVDEDGLMRLNLSAPIGKGNHPWGSEGLGGANRFSDLAADEVAPGTGVKQDLSR